MQKNQEIVYDDTKKQFIPLSEATIPINDLVVLRGYGLQEHVRTYNLHPFHIEEHLERLAESAEILGIEPVPDMDYLKEKIREGLQNFDEEVYLKILLTGGIGNTLESHEPAGLYILFLKFSQFMHSTEYYEGCKLMTYVFQREYPRAKTTDYLSAVVTRQAAKSAGFDDVLYVDVENLVREGSTFSIAGIFGDKIVTPDEKVLEGITMDVALALGRELDMETEKRNMTLSELKKADEVFCTSTTREIVPVLSIDNEQIADGKVGERTQKLVQKFKQHTKDYGQD